MNTCTYSNYKAYNVFLKHSIQLSAVTQLNAHKNKPIKNPGGE